MTESSFERGAAWHAANPWHSWRAMAEALAGEGFAESSAMTWHAAGRSPAEYAAHVASNLELKRKGNQMKDSINRNAARYAATFAADCEPDSIGKAELSTHEFEELALAIGEEAERRRAEAETAGRNFYPCAFAEAAASSANRFGDFELGRLIEAGQLESDSIAGA